VAAYMAYSSHPELLLLSVKIVPKLSLLISPFMLVTLIERSVESERILAGFTQIISTESMDNITLAKEFAEQSTGAGAPNLDSESISLEEEKCLAALDLQVQDTEIIGLSLMPCTSHFLVVRLGTIKDPHVFGARQTSIYILLELVQVNTGTPRLRGKGKEKGEIQPPLDPLFLTPWPAECCYRPLSTSHSPENI
jgi:nuclear pore complex protein Nup205